MLITVFHRHSWYFRSVVKKQNSYNSMTQVLIFFNFLKIIDVVDLTTVLLILKFFSHHFGQGVYQIDSRVFFQICNAKFIIGIVRVWLSITMNWKYFINFLIKNFNFVRFNYFKSLDFTDFTNFFKKFQTIVLLYFMAWKFFFRCLVFNFQN